jgi:hypothetical protein
MKYLRGGSRVGGEDGSERSGRHGSSNELHRDEAKPYGANE